MNSIYEDVYITFVISLLLCELYTLQKPSLNAVLSIVICMKLIGSVDGEIDLEYGELVR